MVLIVVRSQASAGNGDFAKTRNPEVKRQIYFPKAGLLTEGKRSQLRIDGDRLRMSFLGTQTRRYF